MCRNCWKQHKWQWLFLCAECALTASCLNRSTSPPRSTVTMTLCSAEERIPRSELMCCPQPSDLQLNMPYSDHTVEWKAVFDLWKQYFPAVTLNVIATLHCGNLYPSLFNLSKSSKVSCISFTATSPRSLFPLQDLSKALRRRGPSDFSVDVKALL